MTKDKTKQSKPFLSFGRLGLIDAIRSLLLVGAAISVALLDQTLGLGRTTWVLTIGLVGLLVLAAVSLRAWQISKSRALTRLHELFLYLVASLIAFSAVLYVEAASLCPNVIDLRIINQSSEPIDPLSLTVGCTLFLLSFFPLLLAIFRIELLSRPITKQPLLRHDVVSVPTLVITAAILGLIAVLAGAAGSGRFELGQQINVLTMTIVVGGFLAVIFIPNFVRAWNDWTERTADNLDRVVGNNYAAIPLAGLRFSARLASYLDSILVKLIAPLSGATQRGFMVPHALVVLVILPLSAMGFVLAAPYGLLPIGLAALIALSLGRRWAWVEEDREIASRLQSTNPENSDIKVGFDNDLKDEALLGYASLFVLVPLALYQIQGALDLFESTGTSTGNPLLDWLSFFGAELAKAVPFVDWWEIYNVEVDVPFEASSGTSGEWARHLTFASRAIVDLVIMAALFQALTIWQRSRTQTRLYATGELNAFDPFTEEEFFERGMHVPSGSKTLEPKRRFESAIDAHVTARKRLNLEPLPYSRERLGELIKREKKDDLRMGAEWMIKKYEVLAGEPHEQLRQLAQRWQTLEARHSFQSSAPADRAWLRGQKREIERILDALLQDNGRFRGPQIGCLAIALDAVHRRPEFAYARLLSFELLADRTTGKSAALLGCFLVRDNWPSEERDALKKRFSTYLEMPFNLYLGQGRMRAEVLLALASQYPRQGMYAQSLIRELVSAVAKNDGDASVRQKAEAIGADLT
ncbi:MAG: hypothetical protein NXH70_08625 [Hyphomonas sp.]|nr:hypothetical protein [Hyphomonas sp.]